VTSPYETYIENSVLTATPLQLVSMLYRCAIEALSDARRCLASGDVASRVAPVNRAFDAVSELSVSLDVERGGEVGKNLAELYGYISHLIILGHANQSDERFAEAARLLSTLASAWDEVARSEAQGPLR
jgi:flagellar protein FliS